MTEEERRRCCLLGGCGCGSGSPEQRAAFRSWLLEKIAEHQRFSRNVVPTDQEVDAWLDELFTDNPALDLGDDG